MGEDKLTHRQRVRLEAFSQALNSTMAVRLVPPHPAGVVAIAERPTTMADVFARAEEIEAWLWKVDEGRPRGAATPRPAPGPDRADWLDN